LNNVNNPKRPLTHLGIDQAQAGISGLCVQLPGSKKLHGLARIGPAGGNAAGIMRGHGQQHGDDDTLSGRRVLPGRLRGDATDQNKVGSPISQGAHVAVDAPDVVGIHLPRDRRHSHGGKRHAQSKEGLIRVVMSGVEL
jgi:hypothetical protein